MAPVDTTLASNVISAYVPNPINALHTVKHLLDSTVGSTLRGLGRLFRAKSTTAFDGLRPPGDVAGAGADLRAVGGGDLARAQPQNLAQAATMRSRETWRDLPQLPLSEVEDVQRYCQINTLAAGPSKTADAPVQDAFATQVLDKNGRERDVLPTSVLSSSLVNASAKTFKEQFAGNLPAPGQRRDGVMTHLWDGKTGFSAGIAYDPERREMTIGFPGLGASKKSLAQSLRCAMNWLGFVPKNMSQASKLTRLVKEHVDRLNQDLPPDQQIKLTLTGHSMGGGLASYAALRNKVPAVVFNPMRLGWGARARVGQSRLQQADKYLTEVITQGDWVSDSNLSKLYAPLVPVFNIRGPLGHARRFMVPNYGNDDDTRHNGIGRLAGRMQVEHEILRGRAPSVLPHLMQTSARARGDMIGGHAAQAVAEAVDAAMERADLEISDQELRDVATLSETLITGKGDAGPLGPSEIAAARQQLQAALDAVRNRNGLPKGGELPPVLQSIERDFVSHIPQAAQEAFTPNDLRAKQRLQSLYNQYKPGGRRFNAILERFGLENKEIDPREMRKKVGIYFHHAFDQNGEHLSSNNADNQATADKALMNSIASALRDQLYGRSNRLIEEEDLNDLIDRADQWIKSGIPADNAIEEENV